MMRKVLFAVGFFCCLLMASSAQALRGGLATGAGRHEKQRAKVAMRLQPANPQADNLLEEKFWDISTPGTKDFRQFLNLEELTALLQASEETISASKRFVVDAIDAEIETHVAVCKDFLFLELPAGHSWITSGAAALFTDADDQSSISRLALSPVPAAMKKYIQSIVVTFPDATPASSQVSPKRKTMNNKMNDSPAVSVGGEFPGMDINIYTMRSQYKAAWSYAHGNRAAYEQYNISQVVAEFEGEQFYTSNVVSFNARYPPLPNDPIISVQGPNNGGYFGEGNLDLEYIGGMAPNVNTWWVAEKEFSLSRWADAVMTLPQPLPSVASVSWGSGESGFPSSSIDNDNHAFKKLGSLGISVFSASGDQGTGSTGVFFNCGHFDPTWPASSPYVTAVGATYINTNSSAQVSWSGSGGGFSTKIARPSYQDAAVQSYVDNTSITFPPSKYWNSSGRATPDVAALGCNAEVYSSGFGHETGTSIATPQWAGMFTQIIIERLTNGKSPLGFINPSLYQYAAEHNSNFPTVGQDIVSGNNKNSQCKTGFNAASGWDPTSGLGIPHFPGLLKHFTQ